MAKGMEPVARRVRRHGVEQCDDEFLGQGRERLVTMLFPEPLQD
jgi:hypothetical protein